MLMTGYRPREQSIFHLGVDLGLRRDPTALALLEDATRLTGEFDHVQYVSRTERVLILRDLQRLPLETPYADLPAYLERYLEGPASWVSAGVQA